jgi:hypothetical protein
MGLALFKNPADEVESMIEMIDRKKMVYKTTAEVDQTDKNHQVTVNTVSELKKITRPRGGPDQFIRLIGDQVNLNSIFDPFKVLLWEFNCRMIKLDWPPQEPCRE